jgi:hypothetical protein
MTLVPSQMVWFKFPELIGVLWGGTHCSGPISGYRRTTVDLGIGRGVHSNSIPAPDAASPTRHRMRHGCQGDFLLEVVAGEFAYDVDTHQEW